MRRALYFSGFVFLCSLAVLVPSVAMCSKPPAPAEKLKQSYPKAIEVLAQERQRLASQERVSYPQIESLLVDSVMRLSRHWLGTRWGLGLPQTSTPGPGQINCGTFVGTVLRDVGFNVRVKKLQRQPSQLIIESFVPKSRMRKYSNASMEKFLASVREMGSGLFIIGLDFHVGFLIQTDTDLRFIHASYVTKTVVDESAALATPIISSRYRVVGKLLNRRNIRDWLRGRRIKVKGRW